MGDSWHKTGDPFAEPQRRVRPQHLVMGGLIGAMVLIMLTAWLGQSLHTAAGSVDMLIVKLRLSGETPLHAAANAGSERCVALLLAAGADPDAAANDGQTPLHHAACSWGSPHVIDLLCASGADASATQPPLGLTPLHSAVIVRRYEQIEALLKNGAPPNAPDASGRGPLHCAVERSDRYATELLLAAGADPNARDAAGATPLEDANRCASSRLVEMLRSASR